MVVFDEETPHEIITLIQPDILVKGADWGENAIVGRDIVEARGGKVVRIPLAEGYSTTPHHRAHQTADCRLNCGLPTEDSELPIVDCGLNQG